MTLRLFFIIVVLFIFAGRFNAIEGQRFHTIIQAEDTLKTILSSLNQAKDDSSRNEINHTFINDLAEALKIPSSDSYPFDSLKTLVKIASTDNKFRILHWNLPKSDGKHKYYGFIKLLNHDPPLIFPLVDKSDSLPDPQIAILSNLQWFGALYYKVILEEAETGEHVYTLLGWSGKNAMITRKVIEVLSFDKHDRPYFGFKLFHDFREGNMARIIFSFSALATMSLKYEKQAIPSKRTWNSKKRIFDHTVEESPMIVFDRMVPPDPLLDGQYQFYVAAGDIFDGFVFKNGWWSFLNGIEARNKK